ITCSKVYGDIISCVGYIKGGPIACVGYLKGGPLQQYVHN
uniref:Non-specific lipid-transfer protein (Fragments) n=1 Tax=Musa acuminata TaxID=4641 RepID=NLTP_MUSAC|nr:RecName: Full=Non-specific lipid-transfer protein; Short=LTP [Musa acuminata]